MPNTPEITRAGGDWLYEYKWNWYGTLTFEEPVTRRQALQRFNRWILKLEKVSGGRIEYILVMKNHKQIGSIPHLNILLSGVKNGNPLTLLYEWIHTIGVGQIIRYHPGQGASHYINRKLADKNAEVIFSKGLRPAHL